MLCLVLAVCSCDWVPAILFSRPFCSLRRWNSDGEIESIRPSSAELPQWPRHMFFAEAEQGHRDVDGVDGNKDLPRSRCSANTCGYRELRLSTAVQDLCKEGIVLIKSVEKDLYLAIAEARKEEVLKEISPRQHGQLWLDLLRLMMYAYPDPYTESFEFRLRQCCRGLIASTILPFLSIVEWQDLQSGNLTLRQVGYHVILCYGGPNIECRSNFQRLVDFLLYRSTVEDQRSDSWIYLRSEIVEKLKLDERLGETTRHEIGLLQCKELLARDNLDRTGSRPKSSWRLDRRWLATPRLRGIICIMINSHMAFHREGAFIKAFREIVPHILRNKSYSLSTFEKCADVLNSPHDSQEQITKLGVSEFDVQIWFAIASELMGRARFSEANMLWHSIVEQLDFRHDHSACEYLPAVIELIKCCNYLSREAEGEAIASKVLALSADSWNEENLCNLNIVLVDSLIGSKKYGRAEEVLLTALQSGRMPSYIRNIANLRLNKMKRQLGTLTTLESFTSLTEIETDVLDPSTTNAIRYEYLEELSATLSCSDVLQALATSKSSVKAIQKLLNHPNASKDHILLTEIAVYVKGTIRGGFCEEVDQTTERIIQRDSTDSPHGLRPVARQPLNEWNRQAVIAFGIFYVCPATSD